MEVDHFYKPNKFADPIIPIDPIPVDPWGTGPLPPLWDPGPLPPVKDPWDPKNPNGDDPGGIRNPPNPRTYNYYGVVRGAYTEQPLPGATVRMYRNGSIVAQQVADRNGSFNISVNDGPADTFVISEVSHKTYQWPASEVQHTFDLEPDIKDIDPVILPPGTHPPKTNYLVWIIAGLVIAKSQKWI